VPTNKLRCLNIWSCLLRVSGRQYCDPQFWVLV
jgi:hypothetical protein